MADLSITAANVLTGGSRSQRTTATAAGTITQGMPLYEVTSGNVAAAANTSAAAADVVGVALDAATLGQPITYQTDGPITIGAPLSLGKIYVLSAAGLISPVDDVATSDFITYLGGATSTTVLDLNIHALGVQAAADVA